MTKLLIALALFVVAATPAAAQNSAACATTALAGTITVTSPTFDFTACMPASAATDGIYIEVNGSATKLYPTSTPEAANASGRVAFPVSVTLPTRGSFVIKTGAYTLKADGSKQEGPLGTPFTLVYEKAVPTTAPTNHPR